MSRLYAEEDSIAHTDVQYDISEIIVDQATTPNEDKITRERRLSLLFPELDLETDRDINHLTASIVDTIARSKRFGSVRDRSRFINDWYDRLYDGEVQDKLASLSEGIRVFSRTNHTFDDCTKWMLDEVVSCMKTVNANTSSSRLVNSEVNRLSTVIAGYIQNSPQKVDFRVLDRLTTNLLSLIY